MKNLYLIVFILIFTISGVSYASVVALMRTPVSQQSYQSANGPQPKRVSRSASSSVPVAKSANGGNVAEVSKELESQMRQLHQANLQYQQRNNQNIRSLKSKYHALQSKMQKLTQAMLLINQQLSTRHTSGKSSLHQPKKSSISFAAIFKYFAFGLTALLAVMMGVLISRQKK